MKKWEEEQRKKAHTKKVQEAKSTLAKKRTNTQATPDNRSVNGSVGILATS